MIISITWHDRIQLKRDPPRDLYSWDFSTVSNKIKIEFESEKLKEKRWFIFPANESQTIQILCILRPDQYTCVLSNAFRQLTLDWFKILNHGCQHCSHP